MPRHSEQRNLPFPPTLLYDVVADIESYPEFLPWCLAARIRERVETKVTADMVIGFRGLRERFTSRVTFDQPGLKIDVTYEDGPFKYLNNHWKFSERQEGCCHVDFFVDFEFRSLILSKLMDMLFHKAVQRMVAAFEARAREIHAIKPSPSDQTGREGPPATKKKLHS